jgi:TfuA protein
VRRFEAYIFKNRKSLKEKDALKLIEYIRDMI